MSVIGIDLGTTYSCAAVARKNNIHIITNAQGNRVTPSHVAFSNSERLIGEVAKQQEAINPKNTLFQIKRLIGRTFEEESVQQDKKMWNFDVIEENNKPMLKVEYKGEVKKLCPEEVSAMVLGHLKKSAEAFLGKKVTDAVITVPAYFNDAQRKATKDAGTIAGLNVLTTINEPTAAALAYGLERDTSAKRTVLIFDLGGGTFDVTIMDIEDKTFSVLATGGDSHLGGEDFTNAIYKHVASVFNRQHHCDIKTSPKSVSRLREACEQTKRRLSVSTQDNVQVEALYDGKDINVTISRSKFEDLNYDLFTKTVDTVEQVMEDAGLSKNDIDDVVLVGGSTRIPKIRELLESFFSKELLQTINADEAVAQGAAIQAAILSRDCSEMMKNIDLRDVASLSLGIASKSDDMVVVVPRNTRIPVKRWHGFETSEDNQTGVSFPVYEGERPHAKDNHHLGSFVLDNVPPLPKGEAKFNVCFDISAAGLLTVTAIEKSTGNKNDIVISNEKGRLSQKKIDEMVKKAEQFMKQDEEYRKVSDLSNRMEDFIYKTKKSARDLYAKRKMSSSDKDKVLKKCTETEEWLEVNRKTTNLTMLLEKKCLLEAVCHPILRKSYKC